jgi:hypothetical protein
MSEAFEKAVRECWPLLSQASGERIFAEALWNAALDVARALKPEYEFGHDDDDAKLAREGMAWNRCLSTMDERLDGLRVKT